MFMNEYEIRELPDRFDAETQPNAERGARVLLNLLVWTNNNSDGWPYWQAPKKAAEQLMLQLERVRPWGRFASGDVDLTDAELASALRPIKAFMTREIREKRATEAEREWVTDPDGYAKKVAAAADAAVAARTEALRLEAREYALATVRQYVADQRSGKSPDLMDVIADAYLVGARR